MTRRRHFWKAVGFAALAAFLVAALGTTLTDIGPWYEGLKKPWWQPPDWLFGPAWTLIFASAALSAATAWTHAPTHANREWIIGLFSLNGFLNVLWSALFFHIKRPDWALIEVGFFWLSILLLIVVLVRYSKTAAALLIPYLIWVSFAAALNAEVVRLNAPF